MFDAWLADVYAAARDAWGLADEELAGIAAAGVEASFAPEAMRRDLLGGIRRWLDAPEDDGRAPGRPD